jgi:resuscitation-promoting factor RpfA
MGWLTDYKYKGKHREVTERDHRISLALALLSATALSSVSYGRAAADPPGGWESIIACESGGKNIRTQIPGPFTASGFFQITNGTWLRNGGGQFSATAMGASFAEQKIVANNIFRRNPSLSDWNASRSCWASGKKKLSVQLPNAGPTKQRAVVPGNPVPAKAKPKTAPRVSTVTPRSTGAVRVVQRGDTLSRIAGSHWRTVYQLNRAIIGSNPNRIYPGQRLRLS